MRFVFRWVTTAALAPLMIGCGEAERNVTPGVASAPPTGASAAAESPAVLFVGTSLTAGYGLPTEESYPARIQEKIDSVGLPFRVVNAGVSGETSAGALRRTPWLLRQPFQVLVLETGSNDMLRGADLDSTRANIESIILQVREDRPDAAIVLVGMMAPPNLGAEYAERFANIFTDLAERHDLPLIPFLLDGVGGLPEMNLPDGIHPNERGQRVVAENVWSVLEPELRARASGGREPAAAAAAAPAG
jgi:acyl-CoA thioesterase I